MSVSAEQPGTEFVTIRVPPDLAAFIERQAAAMCNSKAGVIRYALTQLRLATEAGEHALAPEPEEVLS